MEDYDMFEFSTHNDMGYYRMIFNVTNTCADAIPRLTQWREEHKIIQKMSTELTCAEHNF